MTISSCREKKESLTDKRRDACQAQRSPHSRAEAIGKQAGIAYVLDATGVGEGPLTQKKVSAERVSGQRQIQEVEQSNERRADKF
jgi:hypothetical protein